MNFRDGYPSSKRAIAIIILLLSFLSLLMLFYHTRKQFSMFWMDQPPGSLRNGQVEKTPGSGPVWQPRGDQRAPRKAQNGI